MLTLPIKKKWFDMIISGEKKEEYREIKPYWTKRFLKTDIEFKTEAIINSMKQGHCSFTKTVIFKNGYRKNSPKLQCMVDITIGKGFKIWGAEPGKLYYVLKILSVEEVTDVKD